MSLVKRTYVDGETVITADNLNDIQDAIIENENALSALGTAATKNVPSSGNAGTNEVVLGNDTRLTDSRNANDVYSWAKAQNKPSYTASEVGAIPATQKGAANGVATLNESGKVPAAQLPSYVDDVINGYYYNGAFYEDAQHTTAITPETGKIYVDVATDKSYRWSGSVYARIDDIQIDETPTENSTNAVQSGGVYTALTNKKNKQNAVSDPTASGTTLEFISGITQDAQGVITPAKKTVKTDATPTSGSTNPVQSGGVAAAIAAISQGGVQVVDQDAGITYVVTQKVVNGFLVETFTPIS